MGKNISRDIHLKNKTLFIGFYIPFSTKRETSLLAEMSNSKSGTRACEKDKKVSLKGFPLPNLGHYDHQSK